MGNSIPQPKKDNGDKTPSKMGQPDASPETNAGQTGQMSIHPANKIVFNGPFDVEHVESLKFVNESPSLIMWATKYKEQKRFTVTPKTGRLAPKQEVVLTVTCNPFEYGMEDTRDDKIKIEWINAPELHQYTREEGQQRFRDLWAASGNYKKLPIEYNKQ